jgi:hypothetical protein
LTHYVFIIRDTGKRRNSIETGPSLRDIEKRRARENKARKLQRKNAGERLLIYYECLEGPKEAAARRDFLLSAEGTKESRRWLQRWDKAEVID